MPQTPAMPPTPRYAAARAALLADPATRHWVRDALLQLEQRDAVDALNDLDTLRQLLGDRLEEMLAALKSR